MLTKNIITWFFVLNKNCWQLWTAHYYYDMEITNVNLLFTSTYCSSYTELVRFLVCYNVSTLSWTLYLDTKSWYKFIFPMHWYMVKNSPESNLNREHFLLSLGQKHYEILKGQFLINFHKISIYIQNDF